MTPGFAPGADPRVSSGMGAALHGEPEGSGSLDRPHWDLGGQEGLDGDGGNLMVSASSGPVGFFPLQGFGFLLL